MKLLKSAIAATAVALCLGSFPSKAEVCLGMACMYNRMTPVQGIDATIGQITEALKEIQLMQTGSAAHHGEGGGEIVIGYIKEALKLTKEINANDKLDRNRNRANDYLKKARTSVQGGDLNLASEQLIQAEKRFAELKGMIDLTQADRVSQQTNLLNRIMDTPDPAAGARAGAIK